MKSNVLVTLLVGIACFIGGSVVGFGVGRSTSPMELGIRRAQRMNYLGTIERRQEAIDSLNSLKTYYDTALSYAKLESTRQFMGAAFGELLIRREMWYDAITNLEMARAIMPGDYNVNFDLATAYAGLYNIEQSSLKQAEYYNAAMSALNVALVDKPDSPDANYLMGVLLYKNNDTDNALKCFQKTLVKQPDNVDALLSVARILYDRGNIEAAKKIYLNLENKLPANSDKFRLVQQNLDQLNREAGIQGNVQ